MMMMMKLFCFSIKKRNVFLQYVRNDNQWLILLLKKTQQKPLTITKVAICTKKKKKEKGFQSFCFLKSWNLFSICDNNNIANSFTQHFFFTSFSISAVRKITRTKKHYWKIEKNRKKKQTNKICVWRN